MIFLQTHAISKISPPEPDWYPEIHQPENTSNIIVIYVDNKTCNNIPTNKSLLDEKTALLSTSHIEKYFVEIHYIPEENKPILEYIMTKEDIIHLLSKYGCSMN